MGNRLKKIKPRVLLSHLLVTLAYPLGRSLTAADHRLLLFTDAITFIGLVTLIGGVVYAMVLHGDFDISGFVLKRGARKGEGPTFDAYMADKKEKHAESFNYPLFLGIVYLAAAALIAWLFL